MKINALTSKEIMNLRYAAKNFIETSMHSAQDEVHVMESKKKNKMPRKSHTDNSRQTMKSLRALKAQYSSRHSHKASANSVYPFMQQSRTSSTLPPLS